MSEKRDYIADKLHSILGITDDTLVDCIDAMIDSAKSEKILTGSLTQLGFPSDKTTFVLAKDLINRFK